MITGFVRGQALKVPAVYVAADTINYLTAQFVFQTSEWNGLEVWSHWEKSGVAYDIRLDDGRITEEMHLNLSAGAWRVYLHGNRYSDGEVVQRITTGVAVIEVQPTGTLDGEPFPEMPASVTEQILARLENVEQNGGGGSGGGITKETDPTVPDWAKQPDPPKYTAADVGAATAQQVADLSEAIADKRTSNVWYGTTSSGERESIKAVTTVSGDFRLEKGSQVSVKFLTNSEYCQALNVDGTGVVYIHETYVDGAEDLPAGTSPSLWHNLGQINTFIYDGKYFIVEDGIRATADNHLFGKVGVSDSVTLDSGDYVASSRAAKRAYDKAAEALGAVTALDAALAAAIGSGVIV